MIQLTSAQMCPFTISPTNDQGGAAPIDGVPAWALVSAEGGTTVGARLLSATDAPGLFSSLGLATDGTAALLYPEDDATIPSCFVTVSADADLGAGVETITAQEEVSVVMPRATNVGLASGQPIAKQPIS